MALPSFTVMVSLRLFLSILFKTGQIVADSKEFFEYFLFLLFTKSESLVTTLIIDLLWVSEYTGVNWDTWVAWVAWVAWDLDEGLFADYHGHFGLMFDYFLLCSQKILVPTDDITSEEFLPLAKVYRWHVRIWD